MMKKIYYGWWIVGATFLILFVCAGIGFSTFPVFLKYLERDMNWDREGLSIASGIAALAAGLTTPFIGAIIERFGLRIVMLPGAVLLSLAYLLLGRIHSIQELYALNLAVGFGLAATTILPSQTLVSRWFERRRGRAMGIVTTASALGSVLWMPLSSSMIESYGWRRSYGMLGVLIGIVSIPLIFLIIRNSPRSMGLELDGYAGHACEPNASADRTADAEDVAGYSLRNALRTNTFWLIIIATFCVVFASSGFGLHVIPFLSDNGLPITRAATIWAAAQGVSIAARFLFGYLSERYQKRYFAAAANFSRLVCIGALLLFALALAPLAVAVALLVVVYGAGMGCNAVTNPLLISESFGVKNFAKIMGVLGIPYTLGMALGMYAGGKLFVLQGNYLLAFGVFAATFLLAGVAIFFAKPCLLLEKLEAQKERVESEEFAADPNEQSLSLGEEVE
jgi:MFS family permease